MFYYDSLLLGCTFTCTVVMSVVIQKIIILNTTAAYQIVHISLPDLIILQFVPM